ncbi:MAG: AAA family ATPase, partial [Actinobacteria bacterium]|nr:AAA family ATPase [Actinomycetota bacterium]
MGQVVNVSVVFTDLVDSTALASSVSPEEADRLRREHFGILRRAVAEAGGTEVKNLGDGLMVVFATASAALACAVGMQQATELDNRHRDMPFGLRVGLSAGEATEEDGDYFGDPVVEAARLCARCTSGQVLAADVVRAMAGRRSPFECLPLGELELKGLPEPVPAVEVRWEPVAAQRGERGERVPLPGRLAARPRQGVVGRAAELAGLTDAFKRASAGDGREVVLLGGEGGLGKTTLVAQTARAAFEAGACVLFGHAEEDLSTPYGLFAEALGHLVTHAPEEELRAHVAECGADLARLVPALCRRLPDLEVPTGRDPETERYLLFSSVVGLLGRVAAERPVVLVLDDLQWADSASLQLLRHVAGEDPASRLLVLGTFRDTEVAAGHPLVDALAALRRMERVTRVDLKGLDDLGVIELLEATGGHELDDAGVALAHAVYRETDGNPFFVTEVLRHLVETGALYRDDATGRWVSDLTLDEVRLPDSVREVVGARVARLGPHAARILSTAAVIGRDFDLELLAAATHADDDDVLDLLEAAETAALVREPTSVAGRFSFTHALIQRTLYQDLSANRRARAHERVAEALEELTAGRPGERVGELAHHWARATRPADAAKAVDYAAAAGDAALAALAPAEAVRWYNEALELFGLDGDPHRRAEILVGLGEAQKDDGRAEYRETLLEAARLADLTDDVDLLVRSAVANNRGFQSVIGDVDRERVEVIDRALERLGDSDPASRAQLMALSAAEQTYVLSVDDRLALVREAMELAHLSGDPATLLRTGMLATTSAHLPWTKDERREWARAAMTAADELDDLVGRFWAAGFLRQPLLETCDRDAYQELTRLQDGIIDRLPARHQWSYTYERAYLALVDGDLDEAERLAEAALNIGLESGQPDAFQVFGMEFANLREAQGRFGELVPMVEDTLRDTPGLTGFRAVLAQACAEAGDLERTRELLIAAREAGFPGPEDAGWLNA